MAYVTGLIVDGMVVASVPPGGRLSCRTGASSGKYKVSWSTSVHIIGTWTSLFVHWDGWRTAEQLRSFLVIPNVLLCIATNILSTDLSLYVNTSKVRCFSWREITFGLLPLRIWEEKQTILSDVLWDETKIGWLLGDTSQLKKNQKTVIFNIYLGAVEDKHVKWSHSLKSRVLY